MKIVDSRDGNNELEDVEQLPHRVFLLHTLILPQLLAFCQMQQYTTRHIIINFTVPYPFPLTTRHRQSSMPLKDVKLRTDTASGRVINTTLPIKVLQANLIIVMSERKR